MKQSTWYNCYDETLKAFITPESFAHPAKMAKRLTERIIEHGEEEGYWRPGDLLADPFGGIGTTGLIGAYRGYQVVSLELEPRFVGMQQDNIKKNAGKLTRLGKPLPVVIQGDARFLSRVLSEAIGSIFSPPYADGSAHTGGNDLHPERMTSGKFIGVGINGSISSPPYAESVHDGNGIDPDKLTGNKAGANSQAFAEGYGETAGQIGALREGKFDQIVGAISSLPYADQAIEKSSTSIDYTRQYETYRAQGGGASFEAFVITQQKHSAGYGASDGQIGKLHEGDFQNVVGSTVGAANGVITSPPWEGGIGGDDKDKPDNRLAQVRIRTGPHSVLNERQLYGESEGQIGAESGETYWQAMRQVYGELYKVIRPGWVAAIVVKDFVRNKQIVPLCDMTATLLEAIGFEIVERTHAMLVKETHAGIDMFSGEAVTKRTERKSFFRRLAESKGSPRIDFEEVIWAQKPGGAADQRQGETIETMGTTPGTAGGAITSPPYETTELDYGDRPNRAAKVKDNPNFIGRSHWLNNDRTITHYGQTEGQISTLKGGDFDQVVKGVRGE